MGDILKIIFSKRTKIKIIATVVIVVVICVILPGKYGDTIERGTYRAGDNSNVPYVVDTAIEEALVNNEEQKLRIEQNIWRKLRV